MLKGRPVKIEELTVGQIKKMYSVMTKYYDNITEYNFYNDLLNKDEAILLYDENDCLHGFTTLAVIPYDENTQLLFSGDTIIEKDYWGNNDLTQAWVKLAFLYAEKFSGNTYWLLLTKGYKTYKFLHTFLNTFYPRVDVTTPQNLQEIMDKFASEKYGRIYQNGVLVAGKDFLKPQFAGIDEVSLKNKDTAFFLEKNPNYTKGDELVCIAELSLDNLNRLGRKVIGR